MAEKLAALKSKGWSSFFANKEPRCPHCGHDFNISDNEAWHLYDENDRHEVDCSFCEEPFTVISRANWSFSTDEQEE